MFDSDMKENLSNEVKVPDADPKVFRGLLHFLYGGVPPENLADVATGLYVIADKHDQKELKKISKASIIPNLNVGNVVDALLLAERYDLKDIMPQARAFMRQNIDEVV